jgi:integrase
MNSSDTPSGTLVVRASGADPSVAFFEAKWRASSDGRQMKRRLGRAWLERDAAGGWRPRRGRIRDGFLDERRAYVAMAEVIAGSEAEDASREQLEEERRRAQLSFRALAHAWLRHVEKVKRVKPTTLIDYGYMLAEPGAAHRRGGGSARGLVMEELGDLAAVAVNPGDVERLLQRVAATGASPRTVNKYRQLVCSIFGYAAAPGSRFAMSENPAARTRKLREDAAKRIEVFTVEQIEALARAAETGAWRTATDYEREPDTLRRLHDEDAQLAELLRLAAYTGLRRGELVALRWRDVRWGERVLTVERALSATVETAPKSGSFRHVPLADQALGALDRLSRREHFTGADDYVFTSPAGDRLDPSAVRRRYIRARDVAGLPALRFHDLRHTAGSLLVRQLDPVSVKEILGHADLKTTQRYLHAQRASALADAATAAFAPAASPDDKDHARRAFTAAMAMLEPDEIKALLTQQAA